MWVLLLEISHGCRIADCQLGLVAGGTCKCAGSCFTANLTWDLFCSAEPGVPKLSCHGVSKS